MEQLIKHAHKRNFFQNTEKQIAIEIRMKMHAVKMDQIIKLNSKTLLDKAKRTALFSVLCKWELTQEFTFIHEE